MRRQHPEPASQATGPAAPYGGFADTVRVENGTITKSDLPGIGFEGKCELITVMRELAE